MKINEITYCDFFFMKAFGSSLPFLSHLLSLINSKSFSLNGVNASILITKY